MKVLLAILVALALAAPVVAQAFSAPSMPWSTFAKGDAAMIEDVYNSGPTLCPQGELLILVASKDRSVDNYVFFYNPESRRLVVVYDSAPNDMTARPSAIGFGLVDSGNANAVPPITWRPFVEATDSEDKLCGMLFQSKV
jgi:hypothetical protein